MKKLLLTVSTFIFFLFCLKAQHLKPGFDKSECLEFLKIGANFGDSMYRARIAGPDNYKFVYRSPVVGMDNMWELWTSDNGIAVISLRGTTLKAESWLENFYAAMVPAKGELHLNDSSVFKYEFGSNPRAAVHVGWLLGVASLSADVLSQIDSLYKTGTREFIITGHSQGGALSFLMTSWLYSLKKQNRLASDVLFKTYCFAGPKVGNTYYAYDFEAMTQYGWAFNVVNSADWVPETMFTIQTVDDFNNTNPFANISELIGTQPFPKNLVLKYLFNQMDKPSRKAEYRFQECLGKGLEKYVMKAMPGFQPPAYYNSMNYVRCGTTIILLADADYYKLFPDSKTNIFVHHLHPAYLYLAEKLPVTNP